MSQIGEPQRVIIVEPVFEPVPQREDVPAPSIPIEHPEEVPVEP